MTSRVSKAAVAGLSLSVAGGLLHLAALVASFASWIPSPVIGNAMILVFLLCPIIGMAVSILAKRDIGRTDGNLRGGGLATAGALIGLLDLLFLRMLMI